MFKCKGILYKSWINDLKLKKKKRKTCHGSIIINKKGYNDNVLMVFGW